MIHMPSHRSIALFSALFTASLVVSVSQAESQRVISVEEQWELHVTQPDTDRSAPQTTMVISPTGDINGLHFLVTLNHATVPTYAPGGVQVQQWDGDELVDSKTVHEGTVLDQSEEVIRWSQRLYLHDGHLSFRVRDGHSETWGDFGGDELRLYVESSLSSLNQYRPGVSLSESQVNYAENRVVSLTLMKLVWITEDGQVHEQSAPIPIDTSLDN
jgi:hypothetical protein